MYSTHRRELFGRVILEIGECTSCDRAEALLLQGSKLCTSYSVPYSVESATAEVAMRPRGVLRPRSEAEGFESATYFQSTVKHALRLDPSKDYPCFDLALS